MRQKEQAALDVFQLTTSRGGRHFNIIDQPQYFYISTHDLTRRSTGMVYDLCSGKGISTHDLTRRSTTTTCAVDKTEIISTHDLTRRSTLYECDRCINVNLFQLTTSRGGRLLLVISVSFLPYFNSRPHEEVDFLPDKNRVRSCNISTHDLTRRSTKTEHFGRSQSDISTHDLTRRSTL